MLKESTPETNARAWIDVDLGALVRNARALARRAGVPLVPMVKADAYGLGAVAVVRALEQLDPLAYGVATIGEGEELRRAGITRPVVMFSPARVEDLPQLRAAALTPTLAARDGIEAWATGGGGAWQLSIDTGMHRAGVPWHALDPLIETLRRHPPDGAFTHFHSAELDDGSREQQEARFHSALERLPRRPRLLHTENSAAILRSSPSAWDCVRPGVFLYGVGCGAQAALQPEPVAHLRARILETREVPAGESVSYDATWRASGGRRIATVACGYADGLRRHLGNRGQGIVAGARVPIVGVVTMDMTMLDITGVACDIGDVVTLLGVSGDDRLTAEEVAERGGLSPYELLTGLRQRLPRLHQGGA